MGFVCLFCLGSHLCGLALIICVGSLPMLHGSNCSSLLITRCTYCYCCLARVPVFLILFCLLLTALRFKVFSGKVSEEQCRAFSSLFFQGLFTACLWARICCTLPYFCFDVISLNLWPLVGFCMYRPPICFLFLYPWCWYVVSNLTIWLWLKLLLLLLLRSSLWLLRGCWLTPCQDGPHVAPPWGEQLSGLCPWCCSPQYLGL